MEIKLQEVVALYKSALSDMQEEVFLRRALQKQMEEENNRLKVEIENLQRQLNGEIELENKE